MSNITWKLLCDVEHVSFSLKQSTTAGIQLITVDKIMIHDTPVPLDYVLKFSSSGNFSSLILFPLLLGVRSLHDQGRSGEE